MKTGQHLRARGGRAEPRRPEQREGPLDRREADVREGEEDPRLRAHVREGHGRGRGRRLARRRALARRAAEAEVASEAEGRNGECVDGSGGSGDVGATWALHRRRRLRRAARDRSSEGVRRPRRPSAARREPRPARSLRARRRDRRRRAAGVGGAVDPARRGARGVEGRRVRHRRCDTRGVGRARRSPRCPRRRSSSSSTTPRGRSSTTRSSSGCSRRSARASTAPCPVLPVADTLKRVRDGVVVETVDREGLVAAQTPQAFLAPTLRRAFAGRPRGRDRLRVARRAGRRPRRGRRGRSEAPEGDDAGRSRARRVVALRAVVFDVGETLVDEERWWRELAERAGLQPHVVWAALGVTIARGEEHDALWGHLGIEQPPAWWHEIPYSLDDLYPDALDVPRAGARPRASASAIVGNQTEALEALGAGVRAAGRRHLVVGEPRRAQAGSRVLRAGRRAHGVPRRRGRVRRRPRRQRRPPGRRGRAGRRARAARAVGAAAADAARGGARPRRPRLAPRGVSLAR